MTTIVRDRDLDDRRVPTTAAELLALRARLLLDARLAWLEQSGASGCDGDDPVLEAEWQARRDAPDVARIAGRLSGPEGVAWRRLVELFQIAPGEADLLSLCVAAALEPALGERIARAQGTPHVLLPTAPLAARLFAHGPRPLWRSNARSSIWRLAQPVAGQPPAYRADPVVVDWLSGHLALDRDLAFVVRRAEHRTPLPEWPVDELAARAEAILAHGTPLGVAVEGREGSGRTTFSACVCRSIGRDAVVVDADLLPAEEATEAFLRIQRFALFADAAVVWRGVPERWPRGIPDAPLQFFVVGRRGPMPRRRGAAELRVDLPEPSVETRRRLWYAHAPVEALGASEVAAMPGISIADLVEAARSAPRDAEDAGDQLRSRARARLGASGRAIDPVYRWEDLVAPAHVTAGLHAIAFEARHRAEALSGPEAARVFATTAALTALFSGPPGVGKSMAAQIVARELCVPLLVIDLAAVSSKYVGETAKNLSSAFHEARVSGAALLFDEADAFFARRTDVGDASDRYANADTSHLLQLLEEHDGLVFLSTNRRSSIDPAFVRRLRHVVEFPMPGPSERRELWTKLLTTLGADLAPAATDIGRLAQAYEVSPAQIKSAVLSARYAAIGGRRAIATDDLDAAIEREFAKEGRSSAPLVTAARPSARRR